MIKIKIHFTLLCIICLCSSLHAQNFVKQGKTWNSTIITIAGPSGLVIHEIQGDTMINGTFYHRVWETTNIGTTSSLNSFLLREDEFGDVYYRANDGSEDHLVLKTEMEVGDQFVVQEIVYDMACPLSLEVADVEPYLLANGETVNKFILISPDLAGWDFYFIEQIGSLHALTTFGYYCGITDTGFEVTCTKEYDVILFQTGNNTECLNNVIVTSINNLVDQKNIPIVSPNPFDEITYLEFQTPIQNGQLSIFDLSGKTVFSGSIKSTSRIVIDSNDLPNPGMYIYKVTSTDGLYVSGKLVLLTK